MQHPSRHEFRALLFRADVNERTGRRYFSEPQRLAVRSRERIEAAIINLGLSHLLAQPLHDPDAAEDLAQ